MQRYVMGGLAALGLLAAPVQAQSLDLGRLLLQGIQVLQVSNLSDDQEIALGRQMDQNLKQRMRIHQDPQLNGWINTMGQRLVPVSERPNIPYTFQVVDSPEVNAFATLGGFVYITTGAIAAAQTEDQVAGVLAHEIAHIASRHGVRQLQQNATLRTGAQALGLDNHGLTALALEVGVARPRSREDEFEADEKGLWMLHRAGYDPQGLPQMLSNLVGRSRTPEFLSTHPAPAERIARLNQLITAQNLSPQPGQPQTFQQQTTRVEIAPLSPELR